MWKSCDEQAKRQHQNRLSVTHWQHKDWTSGQGEEQLQDRAKPAGSQPAEIHHQCPLLPFPPVAFSLTATRQGKEGARCTWVSDASAGAEQGLPLEGPLCPALPLLPAPIRARRTHPACAPGIREPYFSAHCLVFANNPFQACHRGYSTRWHKHWAR